MPLRRMNFRIYSGVPSAQVMICYVRLVIAQLSFRVFLFRGGSKEVGGGGV